MTMMCLILWMPAATIVVAGRPAAHPLGGGGRLRGRAAAGAERQRQDGDAARDDCRGPSPRARERCPCSSCHESLPFDEAVRWRASGVDDATHAVPSAG